MSWKEKQNNTREFTLRIQGKEVIFSPSNFNFYGDLVFYKNGFPKVAYLKEKTQFQVGIETLLLIEHIFFTTTVQLKKVL